MALLFNRAKMSTATTGTGAITLATAASGYQTFAAAGVSDADVIRYAIEDGTDWEIGEGAYASSGTTLTRVVSESSNSGAAISLSGAASVFITATAEDITNAATASQSFATRALMVAAAAALVADGATPTVGTRWGWGEFNIVAESGSVEILDLPGWSVVGVPTPQHFGSFGALKVENPAAPYLLSDVYGSLAAAQAVYPKAAALAETVDDMAFQYMVDHSRGSSIEAHGGEEIDRGTTNTLAASINFHIPQGVYYITRSVDLTGIRPAHSLWVISASSAVIMGCTPSKPIFDFTTSRRCVFLGSAIIMGVWTAAGVSRAGIQIGRELNGKVSDSHMFRGAWEVKGRFSLACLYNFASEDVRWGTTSAKNDLDHRVNHSQFDGSDGVKTFTSGEPVTWAGGTGFVKFRTSETTDGEVAIRVVTGSLADNTTITGTTSTKVADINGTPVAEPVGEGPDGRSYCMVQDGDNKWGLTSDYRDNPVADVAASFLRNTGEIDLRHTGRGDAFWDCCSADHDWTNSYFVADDPDGAAAIVAYSNTGTQVLRGFRFNGHIETDGGDSDAATGLDYAVKFEAASAGADLTSPRFEFERNTAHPAIATFFAGTNVDTVKFDDSEITIEQVGRDVGQVLFSDPTKFSFYGRLSCGDSGSTFFNVSSIADLGGMVHCDSVAAANVKHATATYILTDGAGGFVMHNAISVSGSITPTVDIAINLGSTTERLLQAHVKTIYVTSVRDANSVKVLGTQQAAIADATGGATVDAEARTAINGLLAKMRTHGAIAT